MEDKIKITSYTCDLCKGIGLVILDTIDNCTNCDNKDNRVCYLCENKEDKVRIKECNECYGYGTKFYDGQTNSQVYLLSLQNYRLV